MEMTGGTTLQAAVGKFSLPHKRSSAAAAGTEKWVKT